jgi:hypothetical protein
MRRLTCLASVVGAIVAVVACRSPIAGEDRLAAGVWGGTSIRIDVTAGGATIEYDCAHGTIDEPLLTDRDGRFTAVGTHVREHGGPIRQDESPDRHPARYGGQLSGDILRLTVTLTDSPQEIGTFTLTRGATGRVFKCL